MFDAARLNLSGLACTTIFVRAKTEHSFIWSVARVPPPGWLQLLRLAKSTHQIATMEFLTSTHNLPPLLLTEHLKHAIDGVRRRGR